LLAENDLDVESHATLHVVSELPTYIISLKYEMWRQKFWLFSW